MHYDYVIVGGGAGGVVLAAKLGHLFKKNGPERILLVDKFAYHVWKPTLHEVAVGTLNPQQSGFSYRTLARINHFSFALGKLEKLDSQNKIVTLSPVDDPLDGQEVIPERNISFDNLILCVGSGSNLFNTPGTDKYAYVLENSEDAVHFQTHLLSLFSKASYSKEKELNVVVVGGGATGVEFSTELNEAYQVALQTISKAQHFKLNITILDSGKRILQQLPEKTSAEAAHILDKKGIQCVLGSRAIEVGPTYVKTNNPDIPELKCDVCVWAAGIKASENNKTFGLPTNRINQIEVDKQLQTPIKGIFALGDCAACQWKDDTFVPARAQAAHQEAGFLAQLFAAQESGKPFTKTFAFHDHGSLVSLGDHKGVANLVSNHFFLKGFIAKMMYTSLHISHQLTILGWWKTMMLMLARSAQSRVAGRIKLH